MKIPFITPFSPQFKTINHISLKLVITFIIGVSIAFGFSFSIPMDKSDRVNLGDTLLLVYKDKDGREIPIKSKSKWELKRNQILSRMEAAMGKLPSREKRSDFKIKILDSLKQESYTRYSISFTVAENEVLTAYLYIPFQLNAPRKLPAMLVLHGTDVLGKKVLTGISPKPNRAYAIELAQRGYVVIAPDYPSFGDMKDYDFEKDRYQSGTMKGIFNHIRCVDLLLTRNDVDPERIGVIGHSLGGHNAMFVAAFDKRLKVIVASCGWTLFDYYNIGEELSKKYGGRLGPWAQSRYMPLIRDQYHLDPNKIPFDFDEVIATLAPRPFFCNAPLNDANFEVTGVKIGTSRVRTVYRFLKSENNLQIRYPQAEHDFPATVRLEAYKFIDSSLLHYPNKHELHF
jgi:pimeloyl-ACP methyl ester carboxylesterase